MSQTEWDVRDSEHWLPPAELVTEFDLRPGMTVGEIGARIGYYAIPMGRRVGAGGRVLAVEWRPWLVHELEAHLSEREAPGNVELIARPPEATQLAAASCDLLLFADIWHELERPEAVLDEARRLLRGGGRLAVLEWGMEAPHPPGPPLEHRVSMRRLMREVEMKSWSLVHSRDCDGAGYALVFEVTDESVQS